MKELLKAILVKLNIYHPVQLFYRSALLRSANAYYRVAYSRFKGKGFVCNFCNSSFQKFVPEYPPKAIAGVINKNHVIAGYGENVYCPNCMSRNRERLVLAVIQNLIDIEGKSVLHFSPEKHLYNYLKNKTRITTVDAAPGFYRNIDPAISYADATKLNYQDQSFDMIIANHILEHIPEDIQAMKEMYRVLNKPGVAILQVPYSQLLPTTIEDPYINDPAKQEQLFGQRDHVRIYAFTDYICRLENTGFTVEVVRPENLKAFEINAIQREECVFLCYKN